MESQRDIVLASAVLAVGKARPGRRRSLDFEPPVIAVRVDPGLMGRWEGELKGESKTLAFAFEFTRMGNTMTGTFEVPSFDHRVALGKIAVNGKSVNFDGFGKWTGTLSGDELTLTRQLEFGKKQRMITRRVARAVVP
jgi:hypothetical protein